jgi:hypothetical protein
MPGHRVSLGPKRDIWGRLEHRYECERCEGRWPWCPECDGRGYRADPDCVCGECVVRMNREEREQLEAANAS